MFSDSFARRCNLTRMRVSPMRIGGWEGHDEVVPTKEVAYGSICVGQHQQRRIYGYVVKMTEWDAILGRPWITSEDVHFNHSKDTMMIGPKRHEVPNEEAEPIQPARDVLKKKKMMPDIKLDCVQVGAAAFLYLRRQQDVKVFAISMRDIEKALKPKTHVDPREHLPKEYHQFLDVFSRDAANELPPHRKGVDHRIELDKDTTGRDAEVPWGPMYSMSREQLLVLRKTLKEHLDKGFIRVSQSPAAAPVLFVKKPGGGLRFCVDYRALNQITKKDRYPLPLIQETLTAIGKAKWFTKLDVIAAFHRIRIAEGDEWKTAFRTRYGLYEWMVTPFGLANAPSTFQKYVNWCLRDYLDEFCSAYVDDILIYTDGTRKQHQKHVEMVLGRL